jgi:PAS domain S-box-containing protein
MSQNVTQQEPDQAPEMPGEAVFRDIFEFSSTPSAIFDDRGRCLLANRSFLIQLGYRLDSSGRTAGGTGPLGAAPIQFQDLFASPESAESMLRELRDRQVLRRVETSLRDQDGDTLAVLLSGRTLPAREGPGFEISFTDISRQKSLHRAVRREHARMASLIDNLAAGLFLVNQEGTITEFNQALANLLDLRQQDLLGGPYQSLLARMVEAAAEPEVVQQWLNRAVLNLAERPSLEITLESPALRHLEITFFPVRGDDGLPIGWGGLVQDITELREQSAWKLELLSILSHDLRSPLATLKGHATALLSNYQRWGPDMVTEFLEAIDRSVDNLTRQVDRNLALTRVEAGRLGLRPESVSPQTLVNRAVERAAGKLGETALDRHIPPDLPDVRADPARVEEVLINLLENAVRYNPPDEPIGITARVEDGWLFLTVADRGAGVPADQRERIFEKYARSDSEGGGTGLGLYIGRKIVEAHGGRIWAEKGGPGAAFTFTLPLAPTVSAPDARPARDALSPVPAQEEAGARVLVVEDEADFQALIRLILAEEGYRVELAPDGATALDLVQTSAPDLVLLDWMLPGLDGINVCRNIRRWSSVPIIVVTSKTEQENLIAALDAGADDYLVKPFLADELLARIRALLRRGDRWEVEPERFQREGLLIEYDARQVWLRGKPVSLTATEFELLAYLSRHPRQVLTYRQLISHLWGAGDDGTRHGLSVHVSRLRKKIEDDPKAPRFIVTRWGVGYAFLPEG